MPETPSERSLLDQAAMRAVPEFFAVATLMMAACVVAITFWPAWRPAEFAPLVVSLALGAALAALGWKVQALHTRSYLAAYWLFLAFCAYLGLLQTQSSLDSILTGSAVLCTVMASQLLPPQAARLAWVVLASALVGLYGAEYLGWVAVKPHEPLQGAIVGLALLVLGMVQARLLNRAEREASHLLLEQAQQARASAEETSRAKGDFLSVMSHEIRTPLNGIVGLVTLVQDPRVDEATRQQYLRMLSQSSQALSSLVTDVLDFSKIEADQIELLSEPFSLANWAQDLDASFSAAAAVKGLFLQVDLDISAGDQAVGDAHRLRQIAANYISNAIKFTKAGTIRVRISRPRGDDLLRLEVRDSGIGLSQAAQLRLFKPFQQSDARVHREFGGTGLGLSICERLAQLMNGEVGVTSRPGMGSMFWAEVRLPMGAVGATGAAGPLLPNQDAALREVQATGATRVPSSAPQPQETAPAAGTASSLLGSVDLDAARVLVVDDNAINRTITGQMLRRMNAIVATANDGHEALEALRRAQAEGWPFDMVLMDVQMPGMDGLTAVGHIRQDALLAQTPVVALTAGVLREDVTRAIDAGMDGFMAKPVTAEQLARNVLHFADMGRQRRSAESVLRF